MVEVKIELLYLGEIGVRDGGFFYLVLLWFQILASD